MENPPNPQTVIFILAFLVVYVLFLAKKAARNSIDLFDFMWLSSVAFLPALTVLFPLQTTQLARLIGIEFPFLLLFGLLFFSVFAYLAFTVSKLHKMQRSITRLIQEVSILKNKDNL